VFDDGIIFDVILIPLSCGVGVFVFDTPNTKKINEKFPFIFHLHKEFTYLQIPNVTDQLLLTELEKNFTVERV
jgi:hypothetical protein